MVNILPKDSVFRCVLEYQFPKVFTYRLADPDMPLEGTQDRHFPAVEKLSYDNYLVAVNETVNSCQYQFTLADGANCGTGGDYFNWNSFEIS